MQRPSLLPTCLLVLVLVSACASGEKEPSQPSGAEATFLPPAAAASQSAAPAPVAQPPTEASEDTPEPSLTPGFATLRGGVKFPARPCGPGVGGSCCPSHTVYARDTASGETYSVVTQVEQCDYSLQAPAPAQYILYAWLTESNQAFSGMHPYPQDAARISDCAACQPAPVDVAPGQTKDGLDIVYFSPSAAVPPPISAPRLLTPTSADAAPPGSITHQVQPGDTLLAIAFEYDISLEDLMRANGLTDPDTLSVGQTLIIPVAGTPPPTSPPPTLTPNALLPAATAPRAERWLYYEDFQSDVFGSPSWTRSDPSINVDLADGWLRIEPDGGLESYAEGLANLPLPFVVEIRMRLLSGGMSHRLPWLYLVYGDEPTQRLGISYIEDQGWVMGGYLRSELLAPPADGAWSTLRAALRPDGGDLYVQSTPGGDFTWIGSQSWSISAPIRHIRLAQPWDAACEFDYFGAAPP